jgi:hypothetical protein
MIKVGHTTLSNTDGDAIKVGAYRNVWPHLSRLARIKEWLEIGDDLSGLVSPPRSFAAILQFIEFPEDLLIELDLNRRCVQMGTPINIVHALEVHQDVCVEECEYCV